MPPAPPINDVSVCRLLVCILFMERENGTFVPEMKEIMKAHSLSSDLMSTICLLLFSHKQVLPMSFEAVSNIPSLGLLVS